MRWWAYFDDRQNHLRDVAGRILRLTWVCYTTIITARHGWRQRRPCSNTQDGETPSSLAPPDPQTSTSDWCAGARRCTSGPRPSALSSSQPLSLVEPIGAASDMGRPSAARKWGADMRSRASTCSSATRGWCRPAWTSPTSRPSAGTRPSSPSSNQQKKVGFSWAVDLEAAGMEWSRPVNSVVSIGTPATRISQSGDAWTPLLARQEKFLEAEIVAIYW